MSVILINPKPQVTGLVHISRSFSYRLNIGGYEHLDFFCSQSAECQAEDADHISVLLYDFCKKQVGDAVQAYKKKQAGQQAGQPEIAQRRTA